MNRAAERASLRKQAQKRLPVFAAQGKVEVLASALIACLGYLHTSEREAR